MGYGKGEQKEERLLEKPRGILKDVIA